MGHPDQVFLKQDPTSTCLSRNFSCISHLWQKSAWYVFPFSHNTVMELFSSWFKSQDLSLLLLPDFQSNSETASQALCHWQRPVGNYRQPACFRTITLHTTQEPQKNIFHSCQQWQKAPKYCWWLLPLLSPCIHLWQSHKCVQKALFEEVPVSLARQLICLLSNTEKFIFLFKRSVWQTNLIDPKVCYFTLWPSALLFRVLIRIWPWYQ